MSYFSWEEEEAYREGRRDGGSWHRNHSYDESFGGDVDRAYYEGIHEREKEEEEEEREKEQAEWERREQQREEENRREYERQMEIEARYYWDGEHLTEEQLYEQDYKDDEIIIKNE